MTLHSVLLFTFTAALLSGADDAPFHRAEMIFPLEHWHNHSSSIVELPTGDLLVCWFHGSGERQADDVLINASRFNKAKATWSEPFTLADTPQFPDTNPVLFLDNTKHLWLFWPAIIANEWETALMKYRVSSDYTQAAGPPRWSEADNILLIPRNIASRTKEVLGKDVGPSAMGRHAARMIALSTDKYFTRLGWFTRTHPLQ